MESYQWALSCRDITPPEVLSEKERREPTEYREEAVRLITEQEGQIAERARNPEDGEYGEPEAG